MESSAAPLAANEPTAPLVSLELSPPGPADLPAALRELRAAVSEARFPLEHGAADRARASARALRSQLDDYLVPRAARLDGPVLAVVGGSTGAGKSTLVNSLVRSPVSRAGVLRPTTTAPVLVCHPDDGAWFGGRELMPDVLELVSSPALRPGLALLDAPDFDSVVARNRELANELLASADLWLFVTTAARYADDVPWRVLRGARDRGAVVAVVLDRVEPAVRDDVAADLNRLLSEQGLPAAPLFVVNESTLDGQGLLPADQVEPLAGYLDEVATSEVRRRFVTRRTLLGAISAAAATTDELAWAATEQCAMADALAATVHSAYQRAAAAAAAQLAQGAVLRGTGYARWRECVASGEAARALRAAQDPSRARPAPAPPGRAMLAAVAASVCVLLVEADVRAGDEIADRWALDPAGRPLLTADPDDDHGDLAAADLLRQWQAWVRDEARQVVPTHRMRTRATTTGAVVFLATVAAVAPPAAEVTVTGSASDALRRVLLDPAIVELGERARAELNTRIEAHLRRRAQGWLTRLEALRIDPELAGRLRQAATDVGIARQLAMSLRRAA